MKKEELEDLGVFYLRRVLFSRGGEGSGLATAKWLWPFRPRSAPVLLFQCGKEGVILQPVGLLFAELHPTRLERG